MSSVEVMMTVRVLAFFDEGGELGGVRDGG